jgi:hypothetical protein
MDLWYGNQLASSEPNPLVSIHKEKTQSGSPKGGDETLRCCSAACSPADMLAEPIDESDTGVLWIRQPKGVGVIHKSQ